MVIKLDLRKGLKKLSPDMPGRGQCRYSTPCAVGAMMTREQRRHLKREGADGISVRELINAGFIEVPEGQPLDFSRLQSAFDCRSSNPFPAVLTELQQKYAA